MKVLHVVPYFPPDRIGGVGEMAFHLHRGLLDAGHDSHVVTAGTSSGDPTVERIARSPLGWTFKVAGLARRAADFDVVHCHQGEALALVLAMRALRVRTPVLTTFHMSFASLARGYRPFEIEGRVFGRGWRNWRFRHITAPIHVLMDRWMLQLADEVAFIARSSALEILGAEAGRDATVIYNAVPQTEVASPSPEPVKRDGILFVGNRSANKRSMVLPFVLRHLRTRLPHTRLTLVGVERGELPELAGLLRALGQDEAVTWRGRLSAEELTGLYRSARVVVVPSASEGLPMVILEALRAGTPCVATRVSGHPEAIEDGVSGFLVGVDNPGEMAERCARLLSDPELAERMGQAGREVVRERFSVGQQCERYLAAYTDISLSPGSEVNGERRLDQA